MLFPVRILVGTMVIWGAVFIQPDKITAQESIQGRFIANHLGTVSSEITGERAIRVTELLAREGDKVKKGQLLAKLSTVQLIAARSVVSSSIEEAKALVGVSESNLVGAQLRFNREAGLKNSASFRRAKFEDAEVDLLRAKSALKSAQSVVELRNAEAERIDLEISLANIFAPFEGIVVKFLTNVGASVTQGNPHILEMLNVSRIEIEIEIPLEKLSRFPIGKEVSYSVKNGKKYGAKVRAILPTLSQDRQKALVRLELDKNNLPPFYSDQLPVNVHL